MSRAKNPRMDGARRTASDVENDVIDELLAGRLDRRSFVRRGAILGMSGTVLASVLAACGGPSTTSSGTSTGAAAKGREGGNLRVGVTTPSAKIDPVTVGDQGGILTVQQTGEYLVESQPNLGLRPVLAESWKPNADGSRWTFKIRSGVTFHDGSPMTAKDVAATFNRLADPKNGSNALSAFKGVFSKGGAKATGELEVVFELDAPNGNFPNLVSSDNYNAVILPAGYSGDFEKTMPGTGRFKLEKYTPNQGATFVRYADYWDTSRPAHVDKISIVYFRDEQPALLALQGKEVDVVNQVSVGNARAILTDPQYKILSARSAATRVLHMRTDKAPFDDKRVRQAVALSLDRPGIAKTLFQDRAQIGNDSPFAPVFPSTDKSVPQRKQDLAKARQLMAEAGKSGGVRAPLNVLRQFEIPDYAALIKDSAAKIGVTFDIRLQDPGTYYGDGVFGKSPWLDAVAGITDYGHRGVPNVYLSSQVASDGVWNSAHFKNDRADTLVKQYVAALDVGAQRTAAKELQTLLLDETPMVYTYFYDIMGASASNVVGVRPNANSQLILGEAAFTA
jgi:peptide/nickel transport system substrate-binding protein